MFRANVQIFSVNICGKASNSFRFDSDCYALLLSLLTYVTTLTQFRLIFHVLLLLYFFFKSREADIHFYLCSIIPFHYKKEKDQSGYRNCSEGGQPPYILINGEFVVIHASIMRLNEMWSVAKFLQLQFKNSLNRHIKAAFCCCVSILRLCLYNLIAAPDFLLFQINMTLMTF